jgi:hypothetical protein
MRTYIELNSVPFAEDCVQVDPDADYIPAMRWECTVYKKQLERMFPGCVFELRNFVHAFGTYIEVVYWYDDHNEDQTAQAFRIESTLPEHWDDVARMEISMGAPR